ncbi:MAG: hypothetical protein H3C38_18420 [Rhodospirillales bacterium]|nr:hypothetical protein [Rhodospirillales bacterium]
MDTFPIGILSKVIGLLAVGVVLAVTGYVLPSLRRNAGKMEWLPDPDWTFALWISSLALVVFLALALEDLGKYGHLYT